MSQQDRRSIDTLLGIMATLRDPEKGCPWDREQDFGSIAPYTIEEAYEVADAIARDDLDDLTIAGQRALAEMVDAAKRGIVVRPQDGTDQGFLAIVHERKGHSV